jgi:hypothetical protein
MVQDQVTVRRKQDCMEAVAIGPSVDGFTVYPSSGGRREPCKEVPAVMGSGDHNPEFDGPAGTYRSIGAEPYDGRPEGI